MGEDSTAPQSGRRVTVDEAARYLGLSVDAVRKRVQRGQIAHEKDLAGRVRIILDDSETLQDESPDTPGQSAELVGGAARPDPLPRAPSGGGAGSSPAGRYHPGAAIRGQRGAGPHYPGA